MVWIIRIRIFVLPLLLNLERKIIMLTKITPKCPLHFQSDLGQYNVLKKHLQLWCVSASLADHNPVATIKEFEFPKDVEKLEIIDPTTDDRMVVPINVFKEAHQEGVGYVFNYRDWLKKYKKF